MREVKSVAASERAIQNIRVKYDPDWVKQRVGLWLKTYFDHDHVFVFDASDKPVYSQFDRHALDPSWFEAARPDMQSVLDYMRGRNPALHGTLRLAEAGAPDERPAFASRGDPQPGGPARGHRRGCGRAGRWNLLRARHRRRRSSCR